MAMTEEEHDALADALAQIGVLRDVVAILLSHIRQDATAQAQLLHAIGEFLAMRQAERAETTDSSERQILDTQEHLFMQFEEVVKSGIRWIPT